MRSRRGLKVRVKTGEATCGLGSPERGAAPQEADRDCRGRNDNQMGGATGIEPGEEQGGEEGNREKKCPAEYPENDARAPA